MTANKICSQKDLGLNLKKNFFFYQLNFLLKKRKIKP